MKRATIAVAGLLGLLWMPAGVGPASAEIYACHIGKPSYCFKYGQGLCEKWNRFGDVADNCARWTNACLACHENIPACLGRRISTSDSILCKTCTRKWHWCMARIDAAFWPDRMTGER